jgi:hypothetical protein
VGDAGKIYTASARERERVMTLFKITKLIHDRFGIFINPITIKPKYLYLAIKARINREGE